MSKLNKIIVTFILGIISIAFNFVYATPLVLNPSTTEDAYITIEKALNPPKPKKSVDLSKLKSLDLPDCSHNVKHIVVDYDFDVQANVFKFLSHKGDADCVSGSADFSKSRVEIKLPANSPYVALKGYQVDYSYKFKLTDVLPTNTEYFHVFQLKARTSVPKPISVDDLEIYNNQLDPRFRISIKDRTKPDSEYSCDELPLLTNLKETDLVFYSLNKKNFNLLCKKNFVKGGMLSFEMNAIDDLGGFLSLHRENLNKINNQWFGIRIVAKIIDDDNGNISVEITKLNPVTKQFEHFYSLNTDLDLWGSVKPFGQWDELYPKIGLYFGKNSDFDTSPNEFLDTSMSVYDIKFDRVKLTK